MSKAREQRAIDLDGAVPTGPVMPETFWRIWVAAIAADPQMNLDRAMRHLQRHVGQHIPNADAPKSRWEEWIAGTYNLLAILGHMVQCDPPHTVGIACLFRKWVENPFDHTPPPEHVTPKPTVSRDDEEAYGSS